MFKHRVFNQISPIIVSKSSLAKSGEKQEFFDTIKRESSDKTGKTG